MAVIQYKDLDEIRAHHPGKKIVFCSGSFDLTHAGHVLFFEDCKKLGDILVVGVGGDKVIQKNKGKDRPFINEHLRMKMIDSLKPVDYAILDDDIYGTHSLGFVEFVLSRLQPDTYIVNDDAFELDKRVSLAKEFGAILRIIDRWCPPEYEAISSTKLIEKIKG